MSRSCHSATFSRAGRRAAHHAGKAGDVLGEHGVALVRHGAGALLALGEELLRFQHFGALQVADLDGDPLDRRGDDGEGGEKLACRSRGMTWVETGSGVRPIFLLT